MAASGVKEGGELNHFDTKELVERRHYEFCAGSQCCNLYVGKEDLAIGCSTDLCLVVDEIYRVFYNHQIVRL